MSAPTLAFTFDKPAYYVGEIAQVSVTGATAQAIYTLALKNSQKNELLYLITFQAPSDTFTIPLRITLDWANIYWDKVVLIGAEATVELSKPAVVIEGGGGRLETITVDKTTYQIGEYIQWKASNLIINNIYQVGLILDGGRFLSVPERDRWTATSSEKTGSFEIGTNVSPGDYRFGLFDVTYGTNVLLAYVNIKVVSAPPLPSPPPWWQQIQDFLKSPLGIILLLLGAFLIFRK